MTVSPIEPESDVPGIPLYARYMQQMGQLIAEQMQDEHDDQVAAASRKQANAGVSPADQRKPIGG